MKYGLTEIAGRSIKVLPSKADLFNWLSETLAGRGCEIKRNETYGGGAKAKLDRIFAKNLTPDVALAQLDKGEIYLMIVPVAEIAASARSRRDETGFQRIRRALDRRRNGCLLKVCDHAH